MRIVGVTGAVPPMIPRPRCNRVTPASMIEATPHRGTLMGNRGDIHAADGTLGARRWRGKRWITCTLDHGSGPKVSFDTPGHYYPLFFHDEAVALAAGHRPCAYCRREAFNRFTAAWGTVHGTGTTSAMDGTLHLERLDQGQQRRYQAELATLPDGAFVSPPSHRDSPMLLWGGQLYPWTHAGYGAPISLDPAQLATVFTPASIVAVLVAGYQPLIRSLNEPGALTPHSTTRSRG